MNLVPLIFTFFFILSLAIVTMQKFVEQDFLLQDRLLKHLAIEEELSHKAFEIFSEETVSPLKSKKKEGKEDAEPNQKKFKNHRETKGFELNARLFIKPLFLEKNRHLYKLTVRFLTELYKNAPEIAPKEILDEILEKGALILKKEPKTAFFSLYDLPNPSPKLLLAMQGTKGYAWGDTEGYPRLADYLLLYPKNTRLPICSTHASAPLLVALLGIDKTQALLKEEALRYQKKEAPYYLTKELMEKFFQKNEIRLSPENLALLGDKKIRPVPEEPMQIIVMDSQLRLEARGTLHTYPLKKDGLPKGAPEQTRSIPDA